MTLKYRPNNNAAFSAAKLQRRGAGRGTVVCALLLAAACGPRAESPATGALLSAAHEGSAELIGEEVTAQPRTTPELPVVAVFPEAEPQHSPHPLYRLFEDLAAIEAGEPGVHARILQIGDSHTAGDTLTAPLRELLSQRFGSGGRGYIYAGKPWDSYRQRHTSYDAGGAWTGTLGVRRTWTQPLSLGGARIEAEEAGAWFTRTPCESCGIGEDDVNATVFFACGPEGLRFEASMGPVREVAFCQRNEPELASVTLIGVDPGATLRVEALDAGVTFFGTSMTSASSGVIVEGVGMNGGRADQWSDFDAAFTRAEVTALDVSLVIIAFGTNEAYGSRYRIADSTDDARVAERLAEYAEDYATLINRYTLDGTGASCLAVLSPDFHDEDGAVVGTTVFGDETVQVRETPSSIAAVQRVQREVAESLGCAVWNTQAAMGGPGAMSVWRTLSPPLGSSDGVHLSTAGYSAVSTQLGDDLLAAYEAWTRGEHAQLATTEVVAGVADALAELR